MELERDYEKKKLSHISRTLLFWFPAIPWFQLNCRMSDESPWVGLSTKNDSNGEKRSKDGKETREKLAGVRAEDGEARAEEDEQKSWKRNGSAFPMFQLLLLAVPMTRLNRAREVNPLYCGGGGSGTGTWWKFTFPAFPNRYARTSIRTSGLEIMAGTEESEVLQPCG